VVMYSIAGCFICQEYHSSIEEWISKAYQSKSERREFLSMIKNHHTVTGWLKRRNASHATGL
jgi:hypothetical protein